MCTLLVPHIVWWTWCLCVCLSSCPGPPAWQVTPTLARTTKTALSSAFLCMFSMGNCGPARWHNLKAQTMMTLSLSFCRKYCFTSSASCQLDCVRSTKRMCAWKKDRQEKRKTKTNKTINNSSVQQPLRAEMRLVHMKISFILFIFVLSFNLITISFVFY